MHAPRFIPNADCTVRDIGLLIEAIDPDQRTIGDFGANLSISFCQGGNLAVTHAPIGSIRTSASPLFHRIQAPLNLFGLLPKQTVGACCLLAVVVLAGPSQAGEALGGWAVKSPMPAPRNEVVAAAVNDKIYVFGGSVSGNWRLARNEQYDPANDTWRPRAPLPSGASHMAAAALNGKIYVIGGFIGRDHKGAVDRVFEYDPISDAWRALAPLSTPRGSVSAAVLDGRIHAIGGRVTTGDGDWHSNGAIATHEVYDPSTGKWTPAAPLPKPRDHMVAVAVVGKIHVIGGRFAGNDDMVDWHDVYDPTTNSWTAAPPLPTARGGVSGTAYKGLILVIGGEDEKRTYAENEAYEVRTGGWSKLAPLPAGRHGNGVAAIGSSAYVIGGALKRGSGDTTDQLLVFTLP
jgi:N-acetylneuraminic acid mutarotase